MFCQTGCAGDGCYVRQAVLVMGVVRQVVLVIGVLSGCAGDGCCQTGCAGDGCSVRLCW